MAFVKPGWEVRKIDESEYIPRESMPLTERELFVDFPRLVMGVQDEDEREALIREHFPQLSDKQVGNLKRLYNPGDK